MVTREYESTLNVWMADELKKRGLDTRSEVMYPGNRRIDIEVRIGPVVVAVEAEHGQSSSKRREAVKDADARLEQGLAQCAVAVCYPEGTTRESLKTVKDLIWSVRDDVSDELAWHEGDIDQLSAVIRLMPAQLGDPDAVAASLSLSLDVAVRRLNESQKRSLAEKLDLPSSKPSGNHKSVNGRWDKSAKRALLVVATAVMFHSRLDGHLMSMKPEYDGRAGVATPFTGDWPPEMAQVCVDSDDLIGTYAKAWDMILALDYKPIFETGRAALLSCPIDPAFSLAIEDAARAALAVSANIAGLRHDLLGRIFHRVVETARNDGSFYTTTAAATLLASLAIREDMCDWDDLDAISKLRITDPACGTGTLLMAAAERIKDIAPQLRNDGATARVMIEAVLSGYDINLTAIHMAATTLGLLSPSTRFRSMKIARSLLGVDERDDAFLGSLEFLDVAPKIMASPSTTGFMSQIDGGEDMGHPSPADLVIMNPPFTRDSLRHHQFSELEKRKLQAREKEVLGSSPVQLSSNGNAFLYLADFMVKRDTGRIATVAPLVTATNVSALGIRRYLASSHHIETIVASHDPERIYFSENTSIGELLLVCQRWPDDKGTKPPTRVVNLARNPSTPADAIGVASAIANGTVESQGYGTVQYWPASKISVGNWGAVQFLSPYLCEQFGELQDGRLFRTAALGRIAEIGPDGRGIRGACNRSAMPSSGGMTALWDHKTDVTQSMSAKPDTYITAKPGKEEHLERLWEQRGRMLLPMRVRLNTVRTLSVRLNQRVLGSAWVPCKPDIADVEAEVAEKALCVYLNSSVGVLTLMGNRSNKAPSYPQFSMDDIRKLVVPNFAAVGADSALELATAYDLHAEDAMLPLPYINDCTARRALDGAVVSALDLDSEMVEMIRRHLSMEPSVTGQRYERLGA